MNNRTLNISKSELLLPVGNMNMCLAAIHNGADAIYVGMPEFNARGRTADFTISELKEMIDTCHLYGVKVNLAFNVVIFEDELERVLDLLSQIIPLGPDAIIVQDLGLAKLIHQMSPEQIIHGSTQMTITNHEAMKLLEDLKIKRFVLGREVSLLEMKAIKEKMECELEVFVHGALCVAYSGQCFTSESIGVRSANRGQCAQSCRFEYDMIVDGKKIDLADKRYLVSPKDLCGIEEIPDLLKIGIESFKVEGRLKTSEYVASTAKNYRKAIDDFKIQNISKAKKEMGLTYSRGFFSGWLHGVDHQQLVDGTYGSHRGVEIGTVKSTKAKSIIIKTNELLKKGDGLLFTSSQKGIKKEIGGQIYDIKSISKTEWELFFARDFKTNEVKADFKVYLNHDDELSKQLTKSYQDKTLKKRIFLTFDIEAKVGAPLYIKASDGQNIVEVFSDSFVEEAINSTQSKIIEEIEALSGTCFVARKTKIFGDQKIFINQKELKVMRRSITNELIQKRVNTNRTQITEVKLKKIRIQNKKRKIINILLREQKQVEDLLTFVDEIFEFIGAVYLDFEFGRNYETSVLKLKAKNIKVGIATTRILKPNEYYNFRVIERAKPDIILCRNLGAIEYFRNKSEFEIRGDFSLNVTNSVTQQYLLEKNLTMISASYDLNAKQLENLLKNCDGGTLEITVHQYMPSFHMEHCVFAAFLSSGSSFKDCGKPCEKHRVELKDQFGNFHQIKADQECRNTMFNSKAFSFLDQIKKFIELGASEFRFEALYEDKMELREKIISLKNLIQTPDSH